MFNPFKKSHSEEEINRFEFLKSTKILRDLDFDEIALFVPYLHEREYNQNEVIFFRGYPSHALYFLESGEITFNIEINKNFEELIRLNKRDCFGESSLVKGQKRLLNALVTSENATLAVIPQGNILDIFENNAKIKSKVMTTYAKILIKYNENLFNAYQSSMGFFNLGQIYLDPYTSKSVDL